MDAGYAPATAHNAKDKIETPDVREAFAALIRQKISADKIAQRIAEGLDAEETKFFQKDGAVVESRDVIAWSERRAYAELAAEFGDYHALSKGNSSTPAISFSISFVNAGNQTPTKTS